jgi:hypothetical protein
MRSVGVGGRTPGGMQVLAVLLCRLLLAVDSVGGGRTLASWVCTGQQCHAFDGTFNDRTSRQMQAAATAAPPPPPPTDHPPPQHSPPPNPVLQCKAVGIGILSASSNVHKRMTSRETWMRDKLLHNTTIRFFVQCSSPPLFLLFPYSRINRQIHLEQYVSQEAGHLHGWGSSSSEH